MRELKNNFFKFLLGGTGPSSKFWTFQFVFFLYSLIFTFALFAFSAGSDLQAKIPFKLLQALGLFLFFLPVLFSVTHIIASFRAGGFALTKLGRWGCRIYSAAISVLLALCLYSVANWEGGEFTRGSVEKNLLSGVFSLEMELFQKSGEYVESIQGLISAPRKRGRYLTLGILLCQDSKRGEIKFQEFKDAEEDMTNRKLMETAILEAAMQESCEGRKKGFTAFAADFKSDEKSVYVMSINEEKVLKEVRP